MENLKNFSRKFLERVRRSFTNTANVAAHVKWNNFAVNFTQKDILEDL